MHGTRTAEEGVWWIHAARTMTPRPQYWSSSNCLKTEHPSGGGASSAVSGAIVRAKDASSSSSPVPIEAAETTRSQMFVATTEPGDTPGRRRRARHDPSQW